MVALEDTHASRGGGGICFSGTIEQALYGLSSKQRQVASKIIINQVNKIKKIKGKKGHIKSLEAIASFKRLGVNEHFSKI